MVGTASGVGPGLPLCHAERRGGGGGRRDDRQRAQPRQQEDQGELGFAVSVMAMAGDGRFWFEKTAEENKGKKNNKNEGKSGSDQNTRTKSTEKNDLRSETCF